MKDPQVASERKKGIDKIRYDKIAKFYDRFESPMELFTYASWRDYLFDRMKPADTNLVLEVGVGTGKNIRHYRRGRYVAFDISMKMISRAKARKDGKDVSFVTADAESPPFRDNTFDALFSTFVFCSVENPTRGLREARRTLNPGGKALFLEHMLPKSKILQPIFNLLNPVARAMGPEINRRTDENIKEAGFEITTQENLFLTIFRLIESTKL